MREIALIAGGLIVGGLVGVTWMCLLQVNKDRHYIIQRSIIVLAVEKEAMLLIMWQHCLVYLNLVQQRK